MSYPLTVNKWISSTPPEPIVAEAAAQVLHRQNMVDLRAQNVKEGLIEKGQLGRLVACLLLTLEALENMEITHKANQGQLEQLYTSPIPVVAFFHALFSQQYVDNLPHRRADNGPDFRGICGRICYVHSFWQGC